MTENDACTLLTPELGRKRKEEKKKKVTHAAPSLPLTHRSEGKFDPKLLISRATVATGGRANTSLKGLSRHTRVQGTPPSQGG